ncbi:MAG: cbb3-type cytochrome c oxidase subunit I [Gemmatimonadetes bacterium]|nr:cbb3-type cytochrome c oxidase subunit I [Gemmatimonadota bacterium]
MDWFVRAFIKSALVYLGLGICFGLWMGIAPTAVIYRPAHAHLNLLGFVTMFIFGVAYHVIPRFSGHPLHSVRLATLNWWASNTGLVVLVIGFMFLPWRPQARGVVAAGAVIAAIGALAFVYNLWRTLDGSGPKPRHDSGMGRRLPMSG